jgi:rod shape determining protein RodA
MTELAEARPAIEPLRFWRRELLLLLPVLGLTLLSVYLLSGSEPDYLSGLRVWQKQALWGGMGLVLAALLSRFPIRLLVSAGPTLYVLNLAAVLSLHWIGVEKGGALSWIDLGPIHFQPSETMKIATILMLASLLNPKKDSSIGFGVFLKSVVCAAVPAAVIAVQPDLGTAMVFPGILLAAVYGSRVPRRFLTLLLVPIWAMTALPGEALTWILWGSGVGLWLMVLAWRKETAGRLLLFLGAHLLAVSLVVQGVKPFWFHALKQHQRDRLVSFIERGDADVRDLSPAAYHLRQSLIAISSGGLLGQGLGQGMQSSHGFIPMMRTDFIFAVLAEELGFAGSLILFFLMASLLLGASHCTAHADTWRESSVVFGILGMWSAHTFINLGMTMGLMPITGIPFPFFSYGGTSLLANYAALGLVLSVCHRCRYEVSPFEI